MTRKPPQFTQKKIRDRERATKAVELRVQGLTYQAIADTLGYTDRTSAQRSVDTLLKSVEVESAETLRAQGLMRHESVIREMVPLMQDPDLGIDDRVKAANVIIRAQDSLSRLMGLNVEVPTIDARSQTMIVEAETLSNNMRKALGRESEVIPMPEPVDVIVDEE